MSNTRLYRGYVVIFDPSDGETYEVVCCYLDPHRSWQAAEECARGQQRLYGGSVVTREVAGVKSRRTA